jgi:hypothetical protein
VVPKAPHVEGLPPEGCIATRQPRFLAILHDDHIGDDQISALERFPSR